MDFDLPLTRVRALLAQATSCGITAAFSAGGPSLQLSLRGDGTLLLGLHGRLNVGRRNPGDIQGEKVDLTVPIMAGPQGPEWALLSLERVVETYRRRPRGPEARASGEAG
jgi:hypothetical protein